VSGEGAAEHLAALRSSLATLDAECGRLEAWGERLAEVLMEGGRLLAAGNGGSAAQAQHLTGELVGRYRSTERPALSAIALHADASALTAIANDYGAEEPYARSVRAHGRPGDVLIALSTSGRSPNVLAAVEAATQMEIVTWALTGPAPNPLADACEEAVCVAAESTATVQEMHLVAVHLLCGAVEDCVGGVALSAADRDSGPLA
jgi:D-sedoheptulose 7-phosphate isomerase